jgi:hypothetical protein
VVANGLSEGDDRVARGVGSGSSVKTERVKRVKRMEAFVWSIGRPVWQSSSQTAEPAKGRSLTDGWW